MLDLSNALLRIFPKGGQEKISRGKMKKKIHANATKLAKICYFCQFYAEIVKSGQFLNTFVIIWGKSRRGQEIILGQIPSPPPHGPPVVPPLSNR